MKIAISGSNGYVAKNLIAALEADHHTIIVIPRLKLYSVEQLISTLSGVSTVIHLAGSPILCRWTKKNKSEIYSSRVTTTRNIVMAINSLPDELKPKTFISASAIGIFSNNGTHTENSLSFSDDFVGEVVTAWENASNDLSIKVRKVIFRIGLILGKEAKTIQNLLPLFNLGLGGKIGNGKQPFPFIHIRDVVKAIQWGVEESETNSVYILVAPENITNEMFTKSLAKSIHRLAILTVPAFAINLFLGQASSLLLKSPQVVPERLLAQGFIFQFPDIDKCLADIIQK